MKITGGIVLGYGVIVMLGGLIGYLKADSLISLFTGTLSGAALVACGMGLIRNSIYAFLISLALTTVLAIFFSIRYILTEQMMPSGLMAGLSIIVLLLLIISRGKIPNRAKSK